VSPLPAVACAVLALVVAVVPGAAGASRLAALSACGAAAPRSTAIPTAAAIAAGALLGLLVLGPAGALVLGLGAVAGHRRRARARASRAASAVAGELVDALARIVEELRAGAHPAAALDGVRADGPLAAAALTPAATAAALGDGIPAALAAEAGRRPDVARDLRRMARAWALADRHGVPVAGLLAEALAEMRWRLTAAGRLRAQLAGPRATATVLVALPVLGIALGELIGAAPLAVLRSGLAGQLLVLVGVGLAATGALWTDHLTRGVIPR